MPTGAGGTVRSTTTSSSITRSSSGVSGAANSWRAACRTQFVVAGALPDFDGERLLADAARICEAQIAFWHGAGAESTKPPFERYLFLLNAVDEGHGGLEHRASTALLAARRDLPRRGPSQGARPSRPTATSALLGLVSHEYFHAWNVKRLKPREFARYDYSRENYTGCSGSSKASRRTTTTCSCVRAASSTRRATSSSSRARSPASPRRRAAACRASPMRASMHGSSTTARDENTPNATISYYAKGCAGRARARSDAATRRRGLARRRAAAAVARERRRPDRRGRHRGRARGGRAGARMRAELAAWVHGTDELPLQALLQEAAASNGKRRRRPSRSGSACASSESALTGVKVDACAARRRRRALRASRQATSCSRSGGWRLRRLDDAARIARGGPARAAARRPRPARADARSRLARRCRGRRAARST